MTKTHGMTNTRIYNIWKSMKRRCTKEHDSYKNYGGRGITVCDEWLNSFEKFYEDMGEPTTNTHEIDRIDNDGNYCKENCRWVSPKENCRNRRNNRVITYNDETLCVSEWSERLGGSRHLVEKRLKMGWSEEKAVTTPISKRHQRFNKG